MIIRAACTPGEVRVAGVADGALASYALWRPGRPDGVGDVYRGRVIAHVPGLAGAFLAVGDAEGFLPDSEGGRGLVAGSRLTVRVTRAAQGGKGPRLSARTEQAEAEPGLLRRGPSPIEEFAARCPAAAIVVDDPALAAALRPTLGARVTLAARAFDDTLEDQVAALADPECPLPGSLRAGFYPTPALVAIDLDMAAATARREPKSAAQLAANQAAMPALARQIALRNLSGAIVVDVAGLNARRRPLLRAALAQALAVDPVGPRLLGFTALGLAEIVRPRVRPPLHELLAGPHAAALAALAEVARRVAANPAERLRLVAAPDLLAALASDPAALADLARRAGAPLITRSDPALRPGAWRIEPT